MRRTRLPWQLYPSYLLIILVSLAVVSWYALRRTEALHRAQLERDLASQAVLIEQAIRDPEGNPLPAERIRILCRELGARLPIRITVLLADGKVIGDSAEDPANMENHRNRPEVQAATGRWAVPGWDWRLSSISPWRTADASPWKVSSEKVACSGCTCPPPQSHLNTTMSSQSANVNSFSYPVLAMKYNPSITSRRGELMNFTGRQAHEETMGFMKQLKCCLASGRALNFASLLGVAGMGHDVAVRALGDLVAMNEVEVLCPVMMEGKDTLTFHPLEYYRLVGPADRDFLWETEIEEERHAGGGMKEAKTPFAQDIPERVWDFGWLWPDRPYAFNAGYAGVQGG